MRLASALARARARGAPILVPYLLVDRARGARVARIVRDLAAAGATGLELGFPFSEPIADGPVLAAAHARSLRNGTTWTDLLAAARVASRALPTAVMTYANPLWHRGLDAAMGSLARAGVSGLIVPDLSLEESGPYRSAARRQGLALVLLAAPGVTRERIARIARRSRGFLYVVGHYGTTGGAAPGASVDLGPAIAAAHRAAPHLPVLLGFGIRDRASARRAMATGADGVVVGTAIEERLRGRPVSGALTEFLLGLGLGAPAA
ncbi:MAG TPA: tryptophan synthase subunit alpha [Thermoplasmata archaeon]|nr:tryptophan synthase subunit alpha [Thermoplasmata archaeon]